MMIGLYMVNISSEAARAHAGKLHERHEAGRGGLRARPAPPAEPLQVKVSGGG